MPLVDEQTRVTDRRPNARWPWLLVVAGLALLWLLLSVVISLAPRALNRNGSTTSPSAILQQMNRDRLQSAQTQHQYGQYQGAVAALETLDQTAPMSLSDKHTFLRLAAESYTKGGSPLAGARYYDRFLSMATGIHSAECRQCHSRSSGIVPVTLSDMRNSRLGTEYVAALRAAGKLSATRDRLRADLRKKEKDPRLHLLLYHLEKMGGNPRSVKEHDKKLREFDAAE